MFGSGSGIPGNYGCESGQTVNGKELLGAQSGSFDLDAGAETFTVLYEEMPELGTMTLVIPDGLQIEQLLIGVDGGTVWQYDGSFGPGSHVFALQVTGSESSSVVSQTAACTVVEPEPEPTPVPPVEPTPVPPVEPTPVPPVEPTPVPPVVPPVVVVNNPGVMVNKSYVGFIDLDDNGWPTQGDTLRYELTAMNTGDVTLTNVEIFDDLTGISYPCSDALASGATCPFDAPPIVVNYTVTAADVVEGEVLNTAVASGVDGTTTVTDETDEPVTVEVYRVDRLPEFEFGVPPLDPGDVADPGAGDAPGDGTEDEVLGLTVTADDPSSGLAHTGVETAVLGFFATALLGAGASVLGARNVVKDVVTIRERR